MDMHIAVLFVAVLAGACYTHAAGAAEFNQSSSLDCDAEVGDKVGSFKPSAKLLFFVLCVGLICATKQIMSPESTVYIISNIRPRSSDRPQPGGKSNPQKRDNRHDLYEEPPWFTRFSASLSFRWQLLTAYISSKLYLPPVSKEKGREGYGELYDAFALLFSRFVLRGLRDCYARPICSTPGTEVTLMERETKDNYWSLQFTGETKTCINLGSFNYLGFADSSGPCAREAQKAIRTHGVAMSSSRRELGTIPIVQELEFAVARFLGVEAAAVFGMGFTTNASNLPSLLSKGCLAVSDEKNHASMITGMKVSGATVRVYKHNNMQSLEEVLREAIVYGQPRTHRPWTKIFIVIEGIYSMDGTIVNLPAIVELKKKYKAYIYIDEAHSMGAIGKRGRGAVGHYGIDPRDVDVQMGTLSKAFGSAGAYVAGSKKLVDFLRANSIALCYESAMSPAVAQQSLSAIRILMGEDGTDVGRGKVRQLAENVRYFRKRLREMGLIVYGDEDSPVVPVLVVNLLKLGAAVRLLKDMDVAAVGVCFPATPLYKSRLRFCLSAEHTREHLDKVLNAMDFVSKKVGFRDSQLNCVSKTAAFSDRRHYRLNG